MQYAFDQRLSDWVNVNHHLMTVKEMAEELDISDTQVYFYCNHLGVTAITEIDRRKEFIIKNKHLTQEDLAQKLKINIVTVKNYATDLKLPILTVSQKHKKEKQEATTVVSIKILKPGDEKKIATRTINDEPIKRVPGVYTQSGSEITDKLRGITTTQRIEVNATDAFFK